MSIQKLNLHVYTNTWLTLTFLLWQLLYTHIKFMSHFIRNKLMTASNILC